MATLIVRQSSDQSISDMLSKFLKLVRSHNIKKILKKKMFHMTKGQKKRMKKYER